MLAGDNTMIGCILIFVSFFFFALSMMLMMNRGFLIIANVSFLMGIVALLGPQNAVSFFTKKSKWKASGMYFLGLIVIMIGYPMCTLVGFSLQMYGIYLLFRSFLKVAYGYVQTLPVIGPILSESKYLNEFVNYVSSSAQNGAPG